jgi:hypothetical protein
LLHAVAPIRIIDYTKQEIAAGIQQKHAILLSHHKLMA